MLNGNLDLQNWSDPCTEQTCLPLQSILSLHGLFTSLEFAKEVKIKFLLCKQKIMTFSGKKAKVEDYSRLQEPSSAKSTGMFNKSIVAILLTRLSVAPKAPPQSSVILAKLQY